MLALTDNRGSPGRRLETLRRGNEEAMKVLFRPYYEKIGRFRNGTAMKSYEVQYTLWSLSLWGKTTISGLYSVGPLLSL
jgi:hypothetical protein